jgi:hypothetical protein
MRDIAILSIHLLATVLKLIRRCRIASAQAPALDPQSLEAASPQI